MMKTRLLFFAALLALTGCEDDETAPVDAAVTADAAAADGGACSTFATEHESLLNAPTTATVIRKTVVLPSLPAGDVPPL